MSNLHYTVSRSASTYSKKHCVADITDILPQKYETDVRAFKTNEVIADFQNFIMY